MAGLHSTEYQRGYDAGYKQALLDAIALKPKSEPRQERLIRRGRQSRPLGEPFFSISDDQ